MLLCIVSLLLDTNIQLIFFVTGLGVKTRAISKATLFWQLNLFVHFFVFIYHPLIGYAITSTLKAVTGISPNLLDGLMIAMCLPTTVSGAVVLTVNRLVYLYLQQPS